ncbi:GMC oxidoreductase [Demequina sp. NBRC 110055]|uniref:GMC oxidoreductase n=1 Tax=Demequina sp. NBRC 110055 TaxID=1570344 RepID=UPI000A03A028|nr:GMC family oxidoreductase [Demequina sp. NBRC 110055]
MTGVDDEALARWVGAVLPDAASSASTLDSIVTELRAVIAHDHPEWRPRIADLMARLSPDDAGDHLADPELRWFAALVGQVGVAQPDVWPAIGWSPSLAPMPPGSDLPDEVTACVIDRRALLGHYDAIVIGSGAGGGVAAQELTQAGRTILVIERGGMPPTGELTRDILRSARPDGGLGALAGLPILGSPRGAEGQQDFGRGDVRTHRGDPTRARWSIGAFGLGGGTRVYGAQAWRFAPQDFALASTYGVPDGSSLVDWPVAYEEMEPYYAHAEFEWGVSGAPGVGVHEGERSGPYPLPPLPRTRPSGPLREGATMLGWNTQCVPMLVNSEPYRGRPACVRCAQCIGFACPVGAKAGSQNTSLWRAARTGRMSIILDARVIELSTDAQGRVTGALVRGMDGDGRWERRIDADEFVLGAGAVETARLLLSSRSSAAPDGLGNTHDQVGRHLQGRLGIEAIGLFEEPINDNLGPGPAIATLDFRHDNDGLTGGAVLANEHVPTAASALAALQQAQLVPFAGSAVLSTLARLLPRLQRVAGYGHPMPVADARVTLEAGSTDAWGAPVVRVVRRSHAHDSRLRAALGERAADWLSAAGAQHVVTTRAPLVEPRTAGTARMGDNPGTSVVDPRGRVWGHPNVIVVDVSVFPTTGGVDPDLTTVANAYRVLDGLDEGLDGF